MTQPLKTIGIFSPSSSVNRERFDKGVSILNHRGFTIIIHPQTYLGEDTGNQLAGTPEQKASAFMDLWNNPDVDMIIASCGGNFSTQFLHLLDYQKIAQHPKPIMGFSDTTALLSALYTRAGIKGIFGPTVQTLGRIENLDRVFEMLSGSPLTQNDFKNIVPFANQTLTVTAPIFGATLSVLISLAGTSYFPNLKGHILLLEDIGEELSRLDRMLWQLNQVCPFKNLSALGFGEFIDLKDTGRPLGLNFEEILKKYQDCAIFTNAPVGHGATLIPIPLGQIMTLDFTRKID